MSLPFFKCLILPWGHKKVSSWERKRKTNLSWFCHNTRGFISWTPKASRDFISLFFFPSYVKNSEKKFMAVCHSRLHPWHGITGIHLQKMKSSMFRGSHIICVFFKQAFVRHQMCARLSDFFLLNSQITSHSRLN